MNAQALVCISTLLALSGTEALAQTASKRKSPTSKFYVAEVNNGRVQKFRPRQGANPEFVVGKPWKGVW